MVAAPAPGELEFLATAELLELAEEAGGLGIFEWHVPDDVVRMSPKLLALYGLAEFDGRSASWLERIFREDKPRLSHMLASAFEERSGQMRAEFRIAQADGAPPKWIEGRYLMFYGPDGAPRRVVGVNVDITERKQALVRLRGFTETLEEAVRERQRIEEALREESATLETLNRTGAALAGELELERVVQRVTDAGVEITGAKFGAFFYNSVNEEGGSYMLYTLSGVDRSAFANFPMPRATAVFGPTFEGAGVIRSGDITRDPRYGRNAPFRGMPEGHLPVRSYLAVPVTSRSGEVIGGLFFGHPEPDIFSDRSERVMTGLAAQAAIALDNAALFKAAQRANQTLEQRVQERTSELEQAHEALRQAQKMEAIGQLTGGIAHDFNNLLTVIRGSADLLRRRDIEDEKRKRYVEAISDTADRAARLIGQLLAFARRQALKPEVFDTAKRIRDIAEMLRTVLGSRMQLRIEADCNDCCVEADLAQFETSLVNMAVNARDAMDGEGLLTIGVRLSSAPEPLSSTAEGEFVAVSVTDEGHGIGPDQLERIFEPFFTTKDVGRGTGLGLSQVYGFAKQSGGEIQVRSEVGEGTTFTLYLPRAEGGPAAEAAVRAPAGSMRGQGRVLVVEDNEEVGEFSEQALADLGFKTVLVSNAADALAALEREPSGFDIVFSDVVMPGMSGVELGAEIRTRWPQLPVVLTSGYSHVLAEESGHGFPLLGKPYSVESLARTLRKALS
jgi:signal transduction histidine kinase